MTRSKSLLALALIPLALTLQSCTPQQDTPATPADTIYHNGPILTMQSPTARVEALATANGKILAAGPKSEVLTHQTPDTKLIDLAGHCLMPGFIDPHSHLALQSAKFATVNLDPYPIGDVKGIADIQRKLREKIAQDQLEPGQWVFGWGYDDTGLAEMRHPNRDDLDAVSAEHPILLIHISSHLATCNSAALAIAGITADTPNPPGGVYQRRPGTDEPNGVMEETAWMGFAAYLPQPTPEESLQMIENGLRYYAAAGITTACEGAGTPGMLNLLRGLDQAGRLPIDVVAFPMYAAATDDVVAEIAATHHQRTRFRPGGVKLVIDGSIQGYTAYLTQPYYKRSAGADHESDACENEAIGSLFLHSEDGDQVDDAGAHGHAPAAAPASGADASGDRGYPSMTLEDVVRWVRTCDEQGIPFHAHCNGDAAADLLLEALDTVRGDTPRPDLRTVIIHAQTMRDDQLDAAVRHGLTPSFFPIHVVFWGDRHRDLFLGPERAARINPSRSALDRGLKITLHHDAPIAGISMLAVASAAVNRVTSSGRLLGPDERITPFEALRAITSDAAWQYFEEDRKGTLEPGKLADLVILDADPLAVDPLRMAEIGVVETIKEGVTVFVAE